jgi:hypothetical protein
MASASSGAGSPAIKSQADVIAITPSMPPTNVLGTGFSNVRIVGEEASDDDIPARAKSQDHSGLSVARALAAPTLGARYLDGLNQGGTSAARTIGY